MPHEDNSPDKTVLITPPGQYRNRTMPQGIVNPPVVFQSLVDLLLRGTQLKDIMVHIDDICIFLRSFQQHFQYLELKEKILGTDVLGFPNFMKPFILPTDASTTGLGSCLSQEIDSVLKLVGYACRGLISGV